MLSVALPASCICVPSPDAPDRCAAVGTVTVDPRGAAAPRDGAASPDGATSAAAAASVDASARPPLDVGAPVAAPSPTQHRCAWIFTGDPDAKRVFLAHPDAFDALHPVWFALQPDGVSVRALASADDAEVLAAAAAHHVAILPLVAGVDSVAWVRAMLYSPTNRSAHIRTLVDLAVSRGYAGLDLDYEHLWDPADRAPLAAFLVELGAAMRAAAKHVSMAVPALAGPSTVWSYADLGAALDAVHVMGYDLHTIGTHAGPTAPLGWIDAVNAQIAAAGHAERFLLALPNYGVTPTSSCTLATCASTCTSPVATSSPHMASCPLGPYAAADRELTCDSPGGPLFFDDTASLEDKVKSARAHGLGGVTYWNMGGEPSGFFEMIRRYY